MTDDNLKFYGQLLKLHCFSQKEISEKFNLETKKTENLLYTFKKKKLISSVKKNLYVANSLSDYQSIAEKFEIASKITSNSYIAYHSAFEFYGFANQVYNTVFVSSSSTFRNFYFEGNLFKCIKTQPKFNTFGITEIRHIKTTDIERTILDSIKDFEKIGGLEELLNCLQQIQYADEEILKKYLINYKNQFLFQKAGFILSKLENFKLSKDFFYFCKKNAGKSIRYLESNILKSELIFDKDWNLCVSKNFPIF